MKLKIVDLRYQSEAINQTLDSVKNNKQEIAIEMETGTGKTFTYISTIFALHKEFGYGKFIIVVPRVAIKEGVAKTFEIFAEHFKDKYNNVAFDVNNYEKGKINTIQNFINSNDLQILILTKQSFDKETNILRDKGRDELFGNGSKIEQIKALKPLVIIDEPQLNKDFNQNEIKDLLNPKCILSYSATHPKENKKNIVYQYTPEQAYKDRQVKRLEYFAVELENAVFSSISLEKIEKSIAKIKYNGKTFNIKSKDNLGQKFNDIPLLKFEVKMIIQDNVIFTNGQKITDLLSKSVDEETIIREQIKQTIIEHKAKQQRLNKYGIKTMSLFFVPQVSDFINQNDDGIVKRLFLEEYKNIYNQNADGKYAYYFSETSKIKGTKDNQEKEMTKLILQDKEKMLSLENEVEFIFAHTSLGVGWDNPNIFNICFLRNIASQDSKKQFVGRGLRLCVNQNGERIFEDESIPDKERLNNLTIIGSLQYEQFCSGYQKEAGWTGSDGNSNINNKKERIEKQITIKQQQKAKAQALWQRLKQKTAWYVNFGDLESFYKSVKTKLSDDFTMNIQTQKLSVVKGDITGNYIDNKSKDVETKEYNQAEIIQKIKSKTWLSANEIKAILSQININKVKINPDQWTQKAIEIIEQEKKNHIMSIAEVSYKATGENFADEDFITDNKPSWHDNLVATNSDKTLYNFIDCDSKQEEKFVNLAEKTQSVELFVKLPKGKFYINTPIGQYTPDFALVVSGNNKLYMVFEVKSTKINQLTDDERFKIKCAIKHFELLGFNVEPPHEIEHQGAESLEIAKLNQDCYKVYISNNKS